MISPLRSFTSDNIAGASPEIVEAILKTNAGQALPYGNDETSQRVEALFGELFEHPVRIFPVTTGTVANALCLAALTKPWSAVLCHQDSHINHDECGAPEFFTSGAKLLALGGEQAKIDPAQLEHALTQKIGDVHTVQPACVSITQATEVGSIYSLGEIERIGALCKRHCVGLHMDGARFANALATLECSPADMTWRAGVSLLSFGATKNGAVAAEAIVAFDPTLGAELAFRHKRAGQLMSKMRFCTAQLEAYLRDDLWLRNASHANAMAMRLACGLQASGVELTSRVEANIVFCKLPLAAIKSLLQAGFRFYHDRWEPGVARFVTSFATQADDVDALVDAARQTLRHSLPVQ